MEVPTVAPRTLNVKGKEVSVDLAKKKEAFERVFKAYKDRIAVEEVKTTSVILDFAPLQRLPSKPNFRARFLGFNFAGHCLIRLENKEFPSFQADLNDFYSAEEIKVQNRIDPSELHIGWVVCSERFGSFYRAEVKYIDPLLKFCSVLDIDAGEYHAVDFENLYHLEDRFFHTSAQVIECILDGLENVEKSIYLSVANKLKLQDNKIRVTSVQKNGKGELPVVSVVTSKGDSLIDLLDAFLELDDDNETMVDASSESSSESVIEEAGMTLKIEPVGVVNTRELEVSKRSVKTFMQNYRKSNGIPLLELHGHICQYIGHPIPWKKMGFPHWYIFLYHCEEYFYLKGSPPDRRGNFLVFPANHKDEPNIPAGYTRVDPSILFKLVPSELEIAVRKLNGENTPQKGVLPVVTSIGAGETKTVQNPIRPLVISTMDDSGTDADCSDNGSTPDKQSMVATQQNGIIKEDTCASFFVTSYGKQVEVKLQEETTDYLFYSNCHDGHVPLPMTSKLDLSQFEKPVNMDRTSKTLQVVNKNSSKAEISTKITNPISKGSLPNNFKAKLLGVDMYGFFFIQMEDPVVNSKYEELQRRLNDFYTAMSKSQYRLTGEEVMQEGKVVGFILDGNFIRARIFESNSIECTLVDLESHDFHFVNPVHIYRLDPQFLELPPQAVAVYLNGLESHLYTDAIPQAFQVTQLYPPTVTVEVSNDVDEAYLATSVKMTWGSKNEDVAELLLKSGREFLSPLEEEDWEDRIEAMILVRESLLKKKYLSRI